MLNSSKRLEYRIRRKHIYINDLDDVKTLGKIARYGKWLGCAGFVFAAAYGADQVYETYKKRGDWIAQVIGLGTEFGVLAGVGEALLLLTPVGWVATACVAITEGVLFAVGGHAIEHYTEEAVSWAQRHLLNWL